MGLVHKMIKYYRNSLADAMKKEADRKEFNEGCLISLDDILRGKLSDSVVEYIFEKKFKSKYEEAIDSGWTVDVILCPFIFKVNLEHSSKFKLPETLIPVMMPAQVFSDGMLKHTGKQPWIDRKLLAPSELLDYVVGEVTILDHFLSRNSLDVQENPNWEYFISYNKKMIKEVCKVEFSNIAINEYSLTKDSYVIIDNIINSTTHLRQFYEHIVRKDVEPNKLSINIFEQEPKFQKEIDADECQLLLSRNHYGQMGKDYPLSVSQRETLNKYLLVNDGDVFAVNGPPGTGKTTLLHSIIAQEYVKRAYNGQEPPVIFASSNNNQAVTNIIDSFAKSNEEDILSCRWISGLDSFGSYLVSDSKTNVGQYQTIVEKNITDGFYKEFERETKVKTLKESYEKNGKLYFNLDNELGLKDIILKLKDRINYSVKKIENSIELLVQSNNSISTIMENYKDGFDVAMSLIDDKFRDIENQRIDYRKFANDFDEWYNNQFIIIRILMRFNILKSIYRRSISEFINNNISYINHQEHNSYILIEDFLISWNTELSAKIDHCKRKLEIVKNDKAKYNKLINEVLSIGKSIGYNGDYSDDIYDKINDQMDVGIRYESFMLSVHYYEGLWLNECENNITNRISDNKTEDSKIRFWHRIAKITPCFVSTFYMIPKFLQHGHFSSNSQWVNDYLFNFIDILIIDEAGQASPEVCLPLAMLAKQAVIVGDVNQIQPVWGVERYSDIPNIEKYIGKDKIKIIIDKFYSAHKGNLMSIAKNRSNYKKFYEGGLYLSEHRRCLPEIIEYCNELAYSNKLKPMRMNDLQNYPIPHMYHINCKGKSTKNGGSRVNINEAEFICNWINSNADRFLDYYNSINKPMDISKIFAVVTPFKAQSELIRKKLKSYKNLSNITVGTVHSLQGAERQIVIFSSVYDSDHSGGFFFDDGVNMLNVAISRAKDSFIVIGNRDILKNGDSKPSEILSRYLTYETCFEFHFDFNDSIS